MFLPACVWMRVGIYFYDGGGPPPLCLSELQLKWRGWLVLCTRAAAQKLRGKQTATPHTHTQITTYGAYALCDWHTRAVRARTCESCVFISKRISAR